MKIPNKTTMESIGFFLYEDSVEYRFRMEQLRLVLMPMNTFVLEIWINGKLVNGQLLDFKSFSDVGNFILLLDFDNKTLLEMRNNFSKSKYFQEGK
jgi:hypothetical protein